MRLVIIDLRPLISLTAYDTLLARKRTMPKWHEIQSITRQNDIHNKFIPMAGSLPAYGDK